MPESLPEVQKVHREAHDADPRTQPLGVELKLSGLRRGGTQFPVDIAMSAFDGGSGVVVLVAVHDMTPIGGQRPSAGGWTGCWRPSSTPMTPSSARPWRARSRAGTRPPR